MATRVQPEIAPRKKNRFTVNLLTKDVGSVIADASLSTSSERVYVFRDLLPYADCSQMGKYRVRVSYSNAGTHTPNGTNPADGHVLYANRGLLAISFPGARINNYINGTQQGIFRLVRNESYKRGDTTYNVFNEYNMGNDLFGDIVELRPQYLEIRLQMHTLSSTDAKAYNTTPWNKWTATPNNVVLEFEEL